MMAALAAALAAIFGARRVGETDAAGKKGGRGIMEVYVVTQGSYSSYHVVAIFTDKGIAEQLADRLEDGNTVETYETDEYSEYVRQGLMLYDVEMLKDGATKHVFKTTYMDGQTSLCVWNDRTLYATVWAKDEQHAVKIANEKRAQLIATGEWDRINKNSR
jgi:hypothetical protein